MWYCNREDLHFNVMNLKNGTIIIKNAKKYNQGVYECHSVHSFNVVDYVARAILYVRGNSFHCHRPYMPNQLSL